MSTSSRTPEASEAPKQLNASLGTPATEYVKLATTPAVVSKARLESDLSFLESASLTDFTVVCGKEEWKTHRLILSRCPYFKPIVSENSRFKEAQESSIAIEGFEPFEIKWLLRYIYSLQFDFQQAKVSSPNKSYLETYVLVWSLGDYFSLPDLCQIALNRLIERCRNRFVASRSVPKEHEIFFLPDLEAGIRAAWRSDRTAGPARKLLMSVTTNLHEHLRNQPSFISLLDELPEFTAYFVKTLLGCPGMQYPLRNSGVLICFGCKYLDCDPERDEGEEFVEREFVVVPNSLGLLAGPRVFFCSEHCYDSCLGRIDSEVEDQDDSEDDSEDDGEVED